MIPAPKSKYDSTIEELNKISYDGNFIKNEFRLAQIKREAEKRLKEDPANSYTILGIIACIKKDAQEMHRCHQIAINCSGNSFHTIDQYCSSLFNLELFNDYYVHLLQAHEMVPEDPDILKRLVDVSYYLDLKDSYEKFKERLDRLGVSYDDPAIFIEDDEEWLEKAFYTTGEIISKNPGLIVAPDLEREALVDELIDGVIVD
jgi:hypothetical protein